MAPFCSVPGTPRRRDSVTRGGGIHANRYRAQHLPESINNINQPAPFNPVTNPGGSSRPLNALLPNLGGVSYIASEGISNYNGLQISFQHSMRTTPGPRG